LGVSISAEKATTVDCLTALSPSLNPSRTRLRLNFDRGGKLKDLNRLGFSITGFVHLIEQYGYMETGELSLKVGRHFHHQLMLLQSARTAFFHLTVIKYEKKRDAHDAEFRCQHRA